MYDAIIIGAGVSGCSTAYQLSRRKGRFLVLERASDVCEGTSKANSGIAHGGYDALPGSMKAKMNYEGMRMMDELSKKLDFLYRKVGSLVLCHREEDRPKLEALYQQGLANQTPGLRIVEQEELRKLEPNVADDAICALYCEEAGVIDPFMMNIAFAEQANVNGVEFHFNETVLGFTRLPGDEHASAPAATENAPALWQVHTQNGTYETRAVINAAGVYGDELHNMVSSEKRHIRARRGEYLLLDHNAWNLVRQVVFDLPGEFGKGVLVAPTAHYNVLLGPTADFVDDKEATDTTGERLDWVVQRAGSMIQNIPLREVITTFSGLRAHETGDDFVLEETEEGFFDCIGIESPGLSSAPAIGVYMANLVQKKLHLPENTDFVETRKGIQETWDLKPEQLAALIEKDPNYGQIICRCETVTLAEILDAIRRPLGATTIDGIKRRIRPTAGRCQGGFCTPKLMEILAQELGIDEKNVTKRGLESPLVVGRTK